MVSFLWFLVNILQSIVGNLISLIFFFMKGALITYEILGDFYSNSFSWYWLIIINVLWTLRAWYRLSWWISSDSSGLWVKPERVGACNGVARKSFVCEAACDWSRAGPWEAAEYKVSLVLHFSVHAVLNSVTGSGERVKGERDLQLRKDLLYFQWFGCCY